MELNSRSTEDKFKNQLKIYDELADKLKEKEALEERCDLLSNTIKLKDDIIWKLKNLNPEMTKEIDDLIANYKDKSTSLRKVKDVADDIEGSLRLEIEKLTLNLNHQKEKMKNGTFEDNEETKAQHQQQIDQMEKLHSELNKLRKENN